MLSIQVCVCSAEQSFNGEYQFKGKIFLTSGYCLPAKFTPTHVAIPAIYVLCFVPLLPPSQIIRIHVSEKTEVIHLINHSELIANCSITNTTLGWEKFVNIVPTRLIALILAVKTTRNFEGNGSR